jgi:hypothetical protein
MRRTLFRTEDDLFKLFRAWRPIVMTWEDLVPSLHYVVASALASVTPNGRWGVTDNKREGMRQAFTLCRNRGLTTNPHSVRHRTDGAVGRGAFSDP